MMRVSWLLLGLIACDKSSIAFTIPAGSHDATPKSVSGMEVDPSFDRKVTFDAYFRANAAYATTDAANQDDWNKLMGLCATDHQYNSIRLGWRYDVASDEIELGYYGYLNGIRQSHALGSYALASWIPVELTFSSTGSSATAGTATASESGDVDTTDGGITFLMQTAYFGGDETAPHDIHIDVRDIAE